MSERQVDSQRVSPFPIPLFCLFGVVLLLTSVTLVSKYVFQHSAVQPRGLASVRVAIGFVMLSAVTLLWDWQGLLSLSVRDLATLTVVGILGVCSYAVAACGLMRTSVTHYVLIYSLLPSATAMLSVMLGREWLSVTKIVGIAVSLAGCMVALADDAETLAVTVGPGDGLVLLFTFMMSAHMVCSAGVVKRFGVMVANTVMFGTSSLVLLAGSREWFEAKHEAMPLLLLCGVVYVGMATAVVFLLRSRALQSLPPATVGTYHNLVPIFTIVGAAIFLGESIGVITVIGSGMVVLGAELVRRAQLDWTAATFVKVIAATAKTPRALMPHHGLPDRPSHKILP
ncbi:MAG TPA: DMT family transporter [Nitrospira sp.]|nr:DMT family transporter [Nitrospira sp.]